MTIINFPNGFYFSQKMHLSKSHWQHLKALKKLTLIRFQCNFSFDVFAQYSDTSDISKVDFKTSVHLCRGLQHRNKDSSFALTGIKDQVSYNQATGYQIIKKQFKMK